MEEINQIFFASCGWPGVCTLPGYEMAPGCSKGHVLLGNLESWFDTNHRPKTKTKLVLGIPCFTNFFPLADTKSSTRGPANQTKR